MLISELPHFADCEIRTLAFDYPSLLLKLFDPTEMTYHCLAFRNVIFCVFESDHLQNVVSSLDFFDSLQDAVKDYAFSNYVKQRNLEDEIRKTIGNHRLCYIRPITGGDMIVIFEEIEKVAF
jgi:hypothetical protein